MDTIKKLFEIADHNITRLDATMDYDRVTDVLIALANTLAETEIDENVWYLGEYGEFCLSDLIVGAYWHYAEWHGGQSSKTYSALCALGRVFSPGLSDIEEDNGAYVLLNEMALNA